MCTEKSCGILSKFTMSVVSLVPSWNKKRGRGNYCFFLLSKLTKCNSLELLCQSIVY